MIDVSRYFPFEVELDITDEATFDTLTTWCEENVGPNHYETYLNDQCAFARFGREEQALLCKLAWG